MMMVNAGRERCGERSEEDNGESSDILSLALAVFGGVFLWTGVVGWGRGRVLFFLWAGDGHGWGGAGNAAGALGFTYMKTRVGLVERRGVCCRITRLSLSLRLNAGPSSLAGQIEILGLFSRSAHVSKQTNHSESQGITQRSFSVIPPALPLYSSSSKIRVLPRTLYRPHIPMTAVCCLSQNRNTPSHKHCNGRHSLLHMLHLASRHLNKALYFLVSFLENPAYNCA